jgi:hypothetical protein
MMRMLHNLSLGHISSWIFEFYYLNPQHLSFNVQGCLIYIEKFKERDRGCQSNCSSISFRMNQQNSCSQINGSAQIYRQTPDLHFIQHNFHTSISGLQRNSWLAYFSAVGEEQEIYESRFKIILVLLWLWKFLGVQQDHLYKMLSFQ